MWRLILSIASILGYAQPSFACSPIGGYSLEDFVDEHSIIVSAIPQFTAVQDGRSTYVEDERNPGVYRENKENYFTRFTVLKQYKGEVPQEIDIKHALPGPGNCGVSFDKNKPVLIFLKDFGTQYYDVGLNTVYSNYTDDEYVKYLETGIDPTDGKIRN